VFTIFFLKLSTLLQIYQLLARIFKRNIHIDFMQKNIMSLLII